MVDWCAIEIATLSLCQLLTCSQPLALSAANGGSAPELLSLFKNIAAKEYRNIGSLHLSRKSKVTKRPDKPVILRYLPFAMIVCRQTICGHE